ncbi:MAG: hypothetical protein DRP45_04345 [Candidatus Zixiibacteriota bacterium]|nr:MAG: hypothetical protein DRP45_04345 [candidate division Zixibacteria bacterium]
MLKVLNIVPMLILAVSLASLPGCGAEDPEPPANQAAVPDSPAWTGDQELYRLTADEIVTQFATDLGRELTTALEKGSAVNAIDVCKDKAHKLAAAYSHGGWSIKRVTDKYRNSDNRADSTELAFLYEFEDTTELGPHFLVDWKQADSGDIHTFRFYKPIRIKPACMKCHGNMQTLSQDVYKALRKHYPLDKATGYHVGDLCGMFVVEAVWPDGGKHAERVLSGENVKRPPVEEKPIDSTTTLDTTGSDTITIDSV